MLQKRTKITGDGEKEWAEEKKNFWAVATPL
jgi:hypothetical protein